MKAQIKKGGKIFTGKLAERLIKIGIAAEVKQRGRKPNEKDEITEKQPKEQIKTVKKTVKKNK